MEVVPIGKYKGQPIDVMAQDTQYVEWISAQSWFKERFSALYDALASRQAPSHTPEHNAMQARFLDKHWALATTFALVGADWMEGEAGTHERNRRLVGDWIRARTPELTSEMEAAKTELAELKQTDFANRNFQKENDLSWRIEKIRCELEDFKTLTICHHPSRIEDAEFEHGFDVAIAAQRWFSYIKSVHLNDSRIDGFESGGDFVRWRARWLHKTRDRGMLIPNFAIELKPTLSDDYPAVLRQVHASHGNAVIVGEYTGVGASFDEVCSIFQRSGIRVVKESDVSKWLTKAKEYKLKESDAKEPRVF